MKAKCMTTCTVPGVGYVESGAIINVDSDDVKAFPYLKHFHVYAPKKTDEAPKAKPGKKPVEAIG